MWKGPPGPGICPKCSHLYVYWINFKEMHKKWEEEGIYDLERRENNEV